MSALHQAVERAIGDELDRGVLGRGELEQVLARAAVGVVLAEAAREMRATFTHEATNGDQARAWALGRALTVLAALGDEA